MKEKPKSLDEVDPKLIETYNKLGIPLNEQKRLSGVAVDAVLGDQVWISRFQGRVELQTLPLWPPIHKESSSLSVTNIV